MTKKITYLITITALVALGLAIGMFMSNAHAQSRSAKGISTGNDTISAVIPEVGDLYDEYEKNVALLEGIVACAERGLFVADADNVDAGCRGANAPQVEFVEDVSDRQYASHVRVQGVEGNANVALFSVIDSELITYPSLGTLAGAPGGCQLVDGTPC